MVEARTKSLLNMALELLDLTGLAALVGQAVIRVKEGRKLP